MKPIRVLIVDDSAFARKVLRDVLGTSPRIEIVGYARDGIEALSKLTELSPDVMTLDLVMPHLDGLEVLRSLPPDSPTRVVVVSMADADSEHALAALEAGAVDVIHKPTALATDRLYELAAELVFKVEAAAMAVRPSVVAREPAKARPVTAHGGPVDLVVIGASTGGPQAIGRILRELPADFPVPIGVVVHLPAEFTGGFAKRLDAEANISVREAQEGVRFTPGLAVVARGGVHLAVQQDAVGLWGAMRHAPISLHRPSVDELFSTASAAAPGRVLGVVLTGMGDDGLIGSRALVAAGSAVLVQTEASCVVYGMPRVVEEAGLAAGAFPVEELARELMARVRGLP